MEVIEGVAKLISEHGIMTVLSAVALGTLIWKGKTIGAFVVQTLQASAIVKKNEEIIESLKNEIEELRKKKREAIKEFDKRIKAKKVSARHGQIENTWKKLEDIKKMVKASENF